MINNQDQSPGIPSVLSSMNRLFMVGSEKFVTEAQLKDYDWFISNVEINENTQMGMYKDAGYREIFKVSQGCQNYFS